ncbi:MAG: hypothetical protein J6386_11000 [Candidatus Synoicihabitans palmerolidicus]|nr:hypothetical protein [Candidatus Synoicihabitans palmerolidicus]
MPRRRYHFIARGLLKSANFVFVEGQSADDAWTIFYVATSVRADARHWLQGVAQLLQGGSLSPSPTQLSQIDGLLELAMPHRLARQLIDAMQSGTMPVAPIRDPAKVRLLLDRLHQQEPMFLSALHRLLMHHSIDLAVLFDTITAEDIAVSNELTQGEISSDPFFESRQSAAAGIRQRLIEDKIINPIDQHKHTDVSNPYATLMRLRFQGNRVILRVDGVDYPTPCAALLDTLTKIRRRLYRGIEVWAPDSRAPWATDDSAYHLRFIRQQLSEFLDRAHAECLHILNRALVN